jgi:hypothetical protein
MYIRNRERERERERERGGNYYYLAMREIVTVFI